MMIDQDQTFSESVVFGLGAGVGWALAITALAGVRKSSSTVMYQKGFVVWALPLFSVGLISMCFMSFGGIDI